LDLKSVYFDRVIDLLIRSLTNNRKEELMKPTNVPLSKELKTNRSLQRKLGNLDLKSKFKDPSTKRQRIVLSVTAGHVRGGHSFH